MALQPEMTYHTIEKIPVDAGWSVSRDLTFDPSGLFVYAITTNRVSRQSLSSRPFSNPAFDSNGVVSGHFAS